MHMATLLTPKLSMILIHLGDISKATPNINNIYMVGGISDRHSVEKNGLKECTSDFTGAQNINAQ